MEETEQPGMEIKQEETTEVQPEITEDMDLDIIAKAEDAAERIEKGVATMEGQIRRLEKLKIEGIMSGKADTNISQPAEDTDADYAKKVLANEVKVTK
ncbi:MAG: hypothetical protein DRP42_03845 [Tenericutes bacterium]|nr:MAG: hypothetical protein DRP42_03845 [Mycoplasmatota bacterium]